MRWMKRDSVLRGLVPGLNSLDSLDSLDSLADSVTEITYDNDIFRTPSLRAWII